jgi:hypothetical protein
VLEGVFVPDAVGVEHKNLFGLHVTEDHVLIEHVDSPEQFAGDNICVDLFQVLDVNNDSAYISEMVTLVERNLFGVGQKFSMESEIVQDCHLTRQGKWGNDQRDKDKLGGSSDPGTSTKEDEIVHDAGAKEGVALIWLIQEDSVLIGFHSAGKTILMRALMVAIAVENSLKHLKKKLVLKEVVILEPVVSSVLIGLIVIEDIITIDGPSARNPLMELLIDDTFLGQLIVDVMLSGNLELSIFALALIIMVLLVTVVVTTTASDRVVCQSLKYY